MPYMVQNYKHMNIIISGYGRMGKEVEKICLNKNYDIIAKIDAANDWKKLQNIDCTNAVIVDFSIPDIAIDNFLASFKLGIPIVTGTTGWYSQFDNIVEQCKKQNGSFFYAPNFSIGVNLFFKANKQLANLMSKFSNYTVIINETHHIHKVDAPSGTAIAVADGIISQNDKINSWMLDNNANCNTVPIYASRKGEVTGLHEVVYESGEDLILLKHEAKNRQGFAIGAVMAAEFIVGKKGVYSMDDLLG